MKFTDEMKKTVDGLSSTDSTVRSISGADTQVCRGRNLPASMSIKAMLPFKNKNDTITADNEMELSRHKEIAKGFNAEFYYTHLGNVV